MTLFWIVFAAGIGSMLVYRFGGLRSSSPDWAAWLLIAGIGTAAGIGLTSIIYFVARILVPGFRLLPMLVEIALGLWLAVEIYRHRNEPVKTQATQPFPWNPVLALALLAVLAVGTVGMSSAWEANPQGNWDAWAIWNLRARFLSSGGHLAERAWSPLLTATHPEYPLLLSGFVARCWNYSGTEGNTAPIATAYALFLALVAAGTGGIAALEGGSLGLLFGLAVASSPFLLHEVPSQYADIPLACYFAAAVVLMLLNRPLGAGLMAGLAAWTKDEGLLFLAVFLIAMAILQRRQFVRALAGAIPAGILTLAFKTILAQGTTSLVTKSVQGPGILPKLTDFGRYATVLGALLDEFLNIRAGWYHPILPVIVLAVVLKFKPHWRRDLLPAGTIAGAMLAGYFLVYIVTPENLDWHLATSLNRLSVQVWPLVLIAAFAVLRAPEHAALPVDTPEPPAKDRRTRKR
jgi:hypothetical protein